MEIYLLFIIFAVPLMIYKIINSTKENRIKSMARNLGKEMSDENVKSYIKFLERCRIPNSPEIYNSLRTAFKLVNSSETVSYEVKEKLMNTLLMRGVDVGSTVIRKSSKDREQERMETGKKARTMLGITWSSWKPTAIRF